jgi:hypothetical protein
MSLVNKLESKNIFSESNIIQLASLRFSTTVPIPEAVAIKIQSIKDAILKNDSSEQQIGWRKSVSNSGTAWRSGHGHGHGNSHGHGHGHGHGNAHGHSPHTNNVQYRSQTNTSHNKVITTNSASIPPPVQQGHQRYISRFSNNETPVEDTILNTVILNKLNKFSEVNYEEVKQFLKQIMDSEDTEFLKEFMKLVFRKAASEQTFCPLYARLICELSSQYTSLQKEFEILYKDYLDIFEDIDESKCPDYETFIKRNREKLYRLGYSQFLAELISKRVLQADDLILLFSKILEQISNASRESKDKAATVDEYIQCILRMTRALKNTEIIQSINCFEEPIEYLIQNQLNEFPGLTKKSVFALMDCLDILRSGASK